MTDDEVKVLAAVQRDVMAATGATLGDVDTLARTVYGEARGEGYDGMKAVAHVVINRAKTRYRGDNRVCGAATEPWQFSCWNRNDPNLPKLLKMTLHDKTFRRCWDAAIEALVESNDGVDPTNGSRHYHTNAVAPSWSDDHEPVATIGDHKFFNTVA